MGSSVQRILTVIALLLVVGISSIFVLDERDKAVVLRFGKLINSDVSAGLNFKIPFIDKVMKMDGRLQTLDSKPQRYLTLEKKGLIVDSYVQWRIINVAKFYSSVSGNVDSAKNILSSRIDNGLRNKFGERTLKEVVSETRDELMASITTEVNELTVKDLGIEILDVKIKKVDLPTEVSDSVFSRMVSEREREARELRSKGQQQAEIIRAEANRQKVVIEAEAISYSESVKGQGEAMAANIYAKAYSKDPAFYGFYRKLRTYENSFKNKQDLLVITPDGDMFKTLR